MADVQAADAGAWPRLFSGLPDARSPAFSGLLDFLAANRTASLAALPWIASELAGHEGFETMLAFVQARGGQRLYLARDLARCVRTLGVDVSAATHRRLTQGAGASGLVDAPSAWGVFLALRRVAIDAALTGGASHVAVAGAFGVTTRSLRRGQARTD